MSQSIQEKNKQLVLEAFDTLFNRRNYATAETLWSPKYIQHSAHIEAGREGLFNLIKSMPATLRYEPGLVVADGDYVILQTKKGSDRFTSFAAKARRERRALCLPEQNVLFKSGREDLNLRPPAPKLIWAIAEKAHNSRRNNAILPFLADIAIAFTKLDNLSKKTSSRASARAHETVTTGWGKSSIGITPRGRASDCDLEDGRFRIARQVVPLASRKRSQEPRDGEATEGCRTVCHRLVAGRSDPTPQTGGAEVAELSAASVALWNLRRVWAPADHARRRQARRTVPQSEQNLPRRDPVE